MLRKLTRFACANVFLILLLSCSAWAISDELLEHCEFEQPTITGHYFPVFMEDPEESDWEIPVVDFLINREGQPMQHVFVGKVPDDQVRHPLDLMGQMTFFSPAIACGEPVEGFFRHKVTHYMVVNEDFRTGLEQPAYPRFVFPSKVVEFLALQSASADETRLIFDVTITSEGEIGGISGKTPWSKHLAKEFMPKVMEPYLFLPAMDSEGPIEVVQRLFLELKAGNPSEDVLSVVKLAEGNKPLPIKPQNLVYEEPKLFGVVATVLPSGLLADIQFVTKVEREESIAVINALRNWYIPEAVKDNRRTYLKLVMAFNADSGKADLVHEEQIKNFIIPPKPKKRHAPVYPASLRRAGVMGTVQVNFVINNKGRVEHAEAGAYSHSGFIDSAIAAVKKWRFEPAELDGEPVAARARVAIPFVFNR